MKKALFIISLGFLVSFFAFAEQITITTYYPAPYGVYKNLTVETLTLLNDDESVIVGSDPLNPSIELRDSDADGTTPYIDFSNDGSSDYDMRIILSGDDSLTVTGGVTEFMDASGNPATIKTGDAWYCSQ